jgi:hypothetical protein
MGQGKDAPNPRAPRDLVRGPGGKTPGPRPPAPSARPRYLRCPPIASRVRPRGHARPLPCAPNRRPPASASPIQTSALSGDHQPRRLALCGPDLSSKRSVPSRTSPGRPSGSRGVHRRPGERRRFGVGQGQRAFVAGRARDRDLRAIGMVARARDAPGSYLSGDETRTLFAPVRHVSGNLKMCVLTQCEIVRATVPDFGNDLRCIDRCRGRPGA